MTDVLHVVKRDEHGTKRIRRLRNTGKIPGVLYGHGKESVSLTLSRADVDAAIRHGNPVVKLAGEFSEDAVIKEVQWDAFGVEVLHVDFARVSSTEAVEVTLHVELRGEAPGTHSGGVIEQPLHELVIESPVAGLPDKLEVSINSLELNQSITAGDVPLPEGAKLVTAADDVVVHCVEAAGEEAEESSLDSAAEPEVISSRPAKDDEE